MSESTITSAAGQVPSPVDPDRARGALVAALRRPRFEVVALAGTADEVEQHVPAYLPVTVTVSARRGMEPTLALTEDLSRRGYQVVPHLAARLVVDDAHLAEVLARLAGAGVRDAFVVGGDGERPVGRFPDALSMLTSMQRWSSGVGHALDQIGVTGYPEGHPLLSDRELTSVLSAKQSLATYVVTQMCFDASSLSRWVSRVRDNDVRLPVYVGVAGRIDFRKLTRISARIGVGESARFLRKHRYAWARLLLPGAYRPDRLLQQVATELATPDRRVVGLHIYTLGAVAATEQWRRQLLGRLTGVADG